MKSIAVRSESGIASRRLSIGSAGITLLLMTCDVLAIAVTGIASAGIYHWSNDSFWYPLHFAGIGLLAGLLYAMPVLYSGQYQMQRLLDEPVRIKRMGPLWVQTFVLLLVIGFLTKTSAEFSRGALSVFFVCGLLAVTGLRWAYARVIELGISSGMVARRRVMLVGSEQDIAETLPRLEEGRRGLVVSSTVPLDLAAVEAPDRRDLVAGVARARAMRIDDVVILSNLVHNDTVESVVRAFLDLPAAVHVTIGGALGHFAGARLSNVGNASTVCLTDLPIGPMQSLAKRLLDVIIATMALVLLSPLLLVIAGLIRMESAGPALFRQRRRGFNQEEFRIWKFRSMHTMDDGARIAQVERGDPRVTRVGAFLRRYNLDELPQLINVIRGEMSMVGPRPHAVSHDIHYEKRISAYPRRLNVKPGLTGWAQIHGFRGATPDEADMKARVEHDLYYIENWSLLLDLYIIAMTVLSPRAYRNAY